MSAVLDICRVTLRSGHGAHAPKDGEEFVGCGMDALAWWKHGLWSDAPPCVDRPIRSAFIAINDAPAWGKMPNGDAERTRVLLPLLVACGPDGIVAEGPVVGTVTTSREIRQRRAFVFADWACRVGAPWALEARGLTKEAARLRALPEIVDEASARSARAEVRAAAYAAYAAYAAAAAADAAAAAYAAYAAADAAAYAAYAAAADAAYVADAKFSPVKPVVILESFAACIKRACEIREEPAHV